VVGRVIDIHFGRILRPNFAVKAFHPLGRGTRLLLQPLIMNSSCTCLTSLADFGYCG
jgi:hypothetical protein